MTRFNASWHFKKKQTFFTLQLLVGYDAMQSLFKTQHPKGSPSPRCIHVLCSKQIVSLMYAWRCTLSLL